MRIKIIFILILLAAAAGAYAAGNSTGCRSGGGGYCANLAAMEQIPGLEFIGSAENYGDLIAALYTFGLGFVGISALIMLMIASVKYMTAGGDAGRTGDAKKNIKNAFLGLVIAMLSYLILKTINPDLVKTANLSLLLGKNKIDMTSVPDFVPTKGPGSGGEDMGIGARCIGGAKDCFNFLVCQNSQTNTPAENGAYGVCYLPPGRGSYQEGHYCLGGRQGDCATGLICAGIDNKEVARDTSGVCKSPSAATPVTTVNTTQLQQGEACNKAIDLCDYDKGLACKGTPPTCQPK